MEFVETTCLECVIQVNGFPPKKDPKGNDYWQWMDITLLSNHQGYYVMGWRSRIRRAWKALRGFDEPWVEIEDKEMLNKLIDSLKRVGDQTWPPQ